MDVLLELENVSTTNNLSILESSCWINKSFFHYIKMIILQNNLIYFSFDHYFRYTRITIIYWRPTMSVITDNFVEEAERKKVKFNGKEMERKGKDRKGNEVTTKQLVLQTALQVTDEKVVPCAVVLHETDELEYINYQMNYNRVGLVTDRSQLPRILEKVNELNAMKSGYYHFVVSPDGELHMRHLGILGEDPVPAVNVFIHGGNILRMVLGELAELEGLDLSTHLN